MALCLHRYVSPDSEWRRFVCDACGEEVTLHESLPTEDELKNALGNMFRVLSETE